MKLSVVSSVFGGMSLDEALKFLSSEGVPQLELGVGGVRLNLPCGYAAECDISAREDLSTSW